MSGNKKISLISRFKNKILLTSIFFYVLLSTYYFFVNSSTVDVNWFFDLVYCLNNNFVNLNDYLCHTFNFGSYPIYILEKIFSLKISLIFLTLLLGHVYSYYSSKLIETHFKIKGFFECYLIIFFLFIPFSLGVYYVDQLSIAFLLLSFYFLIHKNVHSLFISSFFLNISFFLKFYFLPSYLIIIFLIFIFSLVLREKSKYWLRIIYYLFLSFLFFLIFLIINIKIFNYNYSTFFDYIILNNLNSGAPRLKSFFTNYFFFNYNLFEIVFNLKIGSLLLYPFIIVFYFSILYLAINLNKSFVNKSMFQESYVIIFFLTLISPLLFLTSGHDWNHKLYYFPTLMIIVLSIIYKKFSSRELDLSNYRTVILILLIIYTSIPLNERFDFKESFKKIKKESYSFFYLKKNYQDKYFDMENTRYSGFNYFLRSKYLRDNNVSNFFQQVKDSIDFLNAQKFIKGENIFVIDEESKLIRYSFVSNYKDPGCYNFNLHTPPVTELSFSIYYSIFQNNINSKDSILILCKLDKDHLCLRSVDIKTSKSIGTNINEKKISSILSLVESNMDLIFNTKNFFIYKKKEI